MTNSPSAFSKTQTSSLLQRNCERAHGWSLCGELRQLSPRTIHERRSILGKLFWFLEREKHKTVGVKNAVGVKELRAFFHYLNTAHRYRRATSIFPG